MATKVKTGVIDSGAITSALITDASITADDLHTTLDLTGKTVTVATASASDNDTSVASTAYVTTAIANLADSAPSTLNTLNELAAALGDDANFSTTVTNSIATKLPLAGGTLTGALTVDHGNWTGSPVINVSTDQFDAGASFATGSFILFGEHDGTKDKMLSLKKNSSDIFSVNSTGRVGIGTGDADADLHLNVTNAEIRLQHAGNSYFQRIFTDSNNKLHFGTGANGAIQMSLETNALEFAATTTHAALGNVLINIPDRQASLYNTGDRGNITIQASSSTTGGQALSGGRVLINAGNSNNGQSGDVIISTGNNLVNSADNGKIRFNIGGRTSSEEAMRIHSDGSVGIGTDTPNDILDIRKANSQLRLTDSDDNKFVQFSYSGGKLITRNNSTNTTIAQVTLIENGKFGIGTINPTAPLDVSREIGSDIAQTSTHSYSSNRNWIMSTNNYGSSNWGGWSLEQSTSAGGTPSVARIGVHLNGNVGINMGGDASTSLTDKNPATALHVGGDITVGSADAVGTGAASAIRFVNDNERSRITSNYASGGGGQMGFWTDTAGGTLLQRAYIKNDGEFNLQHGLRLNGYSWTNSDVLKAYRIDGPGSTTLTRTINVSTYWGFPAQGGAFMYMLHGWQGDSAVGMVHWSNAGNNTQVIVGVYHNELASTGLTSITVAKGSGNMEIDITLNGTHSNTHGWYWKVWA